MTPRLRLPMVSLGTASMVANLLMLTGPLFMLQVYDRVLVSGSLPTLVTLTVLVACLFAFYGLLEAIRSKIAARVAEAIDDNLRDRVVSASVRARLVLEDRLDPIRDSEVVKAFLSGPALLALFDLPWIPVYVAVVFLLHPTLGWLAVGGILVVLLLLSLNEVITAAPSRLAFNSQAKKRAALDEASGAADSVIAMGMLPAMRQRLAELTRDARPFSLRSLDRAGATSAASRSFRFFLQSAVLAVGAYLVLRGEMSAGVMIAASVVTSRALAPVDQVVGQWRQIAAARLAAKRLRLVIRAESLPGPEMTLPPASDEIALSGLACGPPGSRKLLISGLDIILRGGDGVAVAGPSGVGKSTLARTLTGAWQPLAGTYRLDHAELAQYSEEQRAAMIGYLPQDVELMSGTVRENISRFRQDATDGDVIAAARKAGVHDLIVHLPEGYDTPVGPSGTALSAGQRQRIGFARAMFGAPFLVVLDEPNSNLDEEGEVALSAAIRALRDAGSIVVVIAHRRRILNVLSHVLVLQAGTRPSLRQIALDAGPGATTEVAVGAS